MGFKVLYRFQSSFPKSQYFYFHKKYHILSGISEKVHITAKFQKTEFDKYATGHVFLLCIF